MRGRELLLTAGLPRPPTWPNAGGHRGDTCVPVPPGTPAARLGAAGFEEALVSAGKGRFRFRAFAGGV
ncbi:hypothetical protein ACH4PU_19690 [Streptomyces sp. NPDC021100]|uniref:hypothetical protein n=1 Tax=Streptomyces sp. NPDC021100 TaxID=3365114 RepID=UPI00378D46AE